MKTPIQKCSADEEEVRGRRGGGGSGNIMRDDDDIIDPINRQPPSLRDDSTVTSGGGVWSVDGSSSVTERIMGRMKLNLSHFGSIHLKSNTPRRSSLGGGGANNNDDTSSMGSTGGVGHRRRGSGRFGVGRIRRKSESRNNPFDFDRSDEDLGGAGFRRRRSSSWSKIMTKGFRSHNDKSVGGSSLPSAQSSNNERASSKGRKGRSRLSNYSRGRGLNHLGITNADDDSPVEYSLDELRNMNEDDLVHTMQLASVPSEDISNAIHQASFSPMMSEEEIARRKKNSLVALFVNSGHVKLVLKDATPPTTTMVRNTSSIVWPSKQEVTTPNNYETIPIPSSSATTTTASIKSSDSKKKSKLEKIAELKIENRNVRADNKSLKKLVKNLLSQLTVVIEERDHSSNLQHQQSMSSLLEGASVAKSSLQKEDTMLDSSLRSIEETVGTTWDRNVTHPLVASTTDGDSKASFLPLEVAARHDGHSQSDVIQLDVSTCNPASARSQRTISTNTETTPSPSSSSSSPNKTISHLRQQLKKEKGAHENTKFRMKTEIDILTNEVNGLQRELGHTLEYLDEAKEQTHECKESINNMKRELRNASKKVKELRAEAEARDRLIETFSNILLKKIDGISINSGEKEGIVGLEENIAEKSVVENLVMEQGTDSSKVNVLRDCVPTLE